MKHPGVRMADVLAVMARATDLGMGQRLDTALNTCVVATRLGQAVGLAAGELGDVYYLAQLRFIGCTADAHQLAGIAGDELALRREFAAIDPGDAAAVGALARRHIARPDDLARLPSIMHESFSGHCEVAQRLAGRIGLTGSLISCLGQLYERWDGRGQPRGLSGEDVAPAVMIVTLAQDAILAARTGGIASAVAVVRQRAGGAYDPRIAAVFCAAANAVLEGIEDEPGWQEVVDLEPGVQRPLDGARLDLCCEVLADFADLQSPYTLGHSRAVARLAAGAGVRLGLGEAEATDVRRAALLHELGQAGVSAAIWRKNRALTEREWEQVRLHPFYTERVLSRPADLARLGRLASQHHERLDGSGYHRGLDGPALTPAALLIATADEYQAMIEERPHRTALAADSAAAAIRSDVKAGRLDHGVAAAVLAEAGHGARGSRPALPAGLSVREAEVLRLLARGLSNRQVADRLHVAPDTVKRHVQNLYTKAGVSTRAGATLFAVENRLL